MLAKGQTVAGYRILSVRGRGGHGVVYEATQLATGRRAALKVISPSVEAGLGGEEAFRERFRRQRAIEHPHLLPAFDLGWVADPDSASPCLYLAMPFVARPSLKGLIAAGTPGARQAVLLLDQVAGALDALHAVGLVHGDVRPENILVAWDDFAYLTDVCIPAPRPTGALTATGVVLAPFGYAAPEQLEGRSVDGRADVYSLGCVLYECLTGAPPFGRETPTATLLAQLGEEPPSVTERRPDLPQALDGVVASGLDRDPHNRIGTATALIHAAAKALGPSPALGVAVTGDAVGTLITVGGAAGRDRIRGAPPLEASLPRLFREAARTGVVPATEAAAVVSAQPAADHVECTVFAPPSAAPGSSMLVQVFAHLPEEADDARAIALELDIDARRRSYRSLESPVPRGGTLHFELRLPGLELDEPVASLVWRGRTEAVQFGVRVPPDAEEGTVIGTLEVSLDAAPVGHVKFKLAIEPDSTAASSEPQGEEAHRYRVAFISYSSRDRDEVLRRVQVLQLVGIRFFQDVLSLEPGERWSKRLELGIDECDLFLLFWSSEAKESEWVRWEVQHALARKAGDDTRPPEIRPVIVEGPPVVPPWEELAHLHFNDRLLYFMSGAR